MAGRTAPSRSIAARPAVGPRDLRAAGDLLTQAWVAGSPLVTWTPGDLSWWHAQSWPSELGERLRLWSIDGRSVAWSWHDPDEIEGPAEIDYHVWSGDRRRDLDVARAILERTVAEGGQIEASAADDDVERLRLFEQFGFERIDPAAPDAPRHLTGSRYQRTLGGPIPRVGLPAGYSIRSLVGPDDIPARVEVHRAAFAPSGLVAGKYERLISLPLYRFEDDLVVEAPDRGFAAFAMAWWDPVAGVGEFEPVGTHPDHRRRGLGMALLSHALGRYRNLGARLVLVHSDAENVASEGLYRSVGFERRAFDRRYRRAG